jgi:plasmid stability protein
MIQIGNVPDALHRQLKSRAALAGKSPSDHLLDELRACLERRAMTDPLVKPAKAVRAERDGS